jgi:microcystin-dependent protein
VGEVRAYAGATAPTGWLLLNGDTVGAAASGATHQDNVYEDLFTLMWESMADARAPVSGGRGASAAADWAANKSIALPDGRGRAVIGSGTGSGLTARTHGDTGGAETHQLAEAELPSHTHGLGTLAVDAVGDHTHSVGFSSNNNAKGAGLGGVVPGSSVSGAGGGHSHSLSGTLASVGSDTAHANMQPWLALNYIVKY